MMQSSAQASDQAAQSPPLPFRDSGDAARDRRDWGSAVRDYEAHLTLFPDDFDILVQLGHVRKEAGDLSGAERAYHVARRLRPGDSDLLLNLGHLMKLRSDAAGALEYYRSSHEIDANDDAAREIAALELHARAMKTASRLEADLAKRFSTVYRENLWGDAESRSGAGSRRDSTMVADALAALQTAHDDYGIRTISDIPCGDFNWIGAFLEKNPDVVYCGYDIVRDAVERNRRRFASHAFDVLDVTVRLPPRSDLIFCKDLLNHLSYADARKAMANMKASGSTYILLSNNFGFENKELETVNNHASRNLDITVPPMSRPNPIWRVGYIGFWRLADL